jgi:RNA polymerase sigma factor (TIGR02999 family)
LSRLAPNQVTELLIKWRDGDQSALKDLVPLVYGELRRLAHHYLRFERPDHTLQSTALVHEAFLRLVSQEPGNLQNRAHFMAVASQLMRQILVDFARSHRAAKRNQGYTLSLDEAAVLPQAKDVDLIALDDALHRLARLSERQSRIVELRFFGGLSIDETSHVLGVSRATVERDWTIARAWLHREISGSAKHDS